MLQLSPHPQGLAEACKLVLTLTLWHLWPEARGEAHPVSHGALLCCCSLGWDHTLHLAARVMFCFFPLRVSCERACVSLGSRGIC